MRLARLVPHRWQKLIHEALRFGAVGGINLVVNYAVFNALVLTVFPTGQLKATVLATVVSTTTSYLMNRHWTFGDRPRSAMRREYLLFFFFNATGLAIELAVLGAAKYALGLTSLLALNAAKTIGVAIGTVFRFWSYRTFVFQSAPDYAGQMADQTAVAEPTVVAEPAVVAEPTVVAEATRAVPTRTETDDVLASLDRELALELNADPVRR